jgi:hypothetical protein
MTLFPTSPGHFCIFILMKKATFPTSPGAFFKKSSKKDAFPKKPQTSNI